jgi:hypothetical protein
LEKTKTKITIDVTSETSRQTAGKVSAVLRYFLFIRLKEMSKLTSKPIGAPVFWLRIEQDTSTTQATRVIAVVTR